MRLTWYGHAAFRIEAADVDIIIDPYKYPDAGGYLPIDDSADLVLISHVNDRYHSHTGQIRPPFELLNGLLIPAEGVDYRGVSIRSMHVFENDSKLPEDEVTILDLSVDGIRIVFLGDLGHALSVDEADRLRGVDILLASAGGPPTIALPLIPALVAQLEPRIIIPMHYKTPKINLPIQQVQDFFEVLPEWRVERLSSSTVELSADDLPPRGVILSLQHAR
jgi:L-ascorbate metabolism protein UlaG (beta-lactamase superfamily)